MEKDEARVHEELTRKRLTAKNEQCERWNQYLEGLFHVKGDRNCVFLAQPGMRVVLSKKVFLELGKKRYQKKLKKFKSGRTNV